MRWLIQHSLAQEAEQQRLWRVMCARQTYTTASVMNRTKYQIISSKSILVVPLPHHACTVPRNISQMNQQGKRMDLHFQSPITSTMPYLLDCNNFIKVMMENITTSETMSEVAIRFCSKHSHFRYPGFINKLYFTCAWTCIHMLCEVNKLCTLHHFWI